MSSPGAGTGTITGTIITGTTNMDISTTGTTQDARLPLVCLECGKKWTCNIERDPHGTCPRCGSNDWEVA